MTIAQEIMMHGDDARKGMHAIFGKCRQADAVTIIMHKNQSPAACILLR